MDNENPIVALCVRGLAAETNRQVDDAIELYRQAWDSSTDHFEACVAAHYLARHQPTPRETMYWNHLALARAHAAEQAADHDRVRGFFASLHLNLGASHETLDQLPQARRHYELAADALAHVPDGGYRAVVEDGITRGLERTAMHA